MKIINLGKIKPASPPFWVGLQLMCGKCDTLVELEASDTVDTQSERRLGGEIIVRAKCPVCAHNIEKTMKFDNSMRVK